MTVAALALVLLGLSAAPASAQPPRAPLAPLRLRDLPALGSGRHPPRSDTVAALAALRTSMAIRLRRLPARLNTEKFSRWARTVMQPWVVRKRAAVEAVDDASRRALERAFASAQESDFTGQPLREEAIVPALRAIAVDDFAGAILALPAPLELQRDPALQQVYRETLESMVAPMLAEALSGYAFCARQRGAPDWSAFCAQRAAAIRATGLVPAAEP